MYICEKERIAIKIDRNNCVTIGYKEDGIYSNEGGVSAEMCLNAVKEAAKARGLSIHPKLVYTLGTGKNAMEIDPEAWKKGREFVFSAYKPNSTTPQILERPIGMEFQSGRKAVQWI